MRPLLQRIVVSTLGLFMLVGAFAMTSGCNTVEGAGDDVKSVGDSVEKATDK